MLKPDGTFWLAIGDEYAAELKVMLQQEHRLSCRSWVVWYYTFGVNCKMKFSRSHAHLFHMVKDPKKFTFNAEAIRVPSARQLVYGDRRANPAGRLPDDTWILRPQDLPEGFQAGGRHLVFSPGVRARSRSGPAGTAARCPSNCWAGSSARAATRANWCSIPFAGSGTTLAVAKKLGRRFWASSFRKQYAAADQEAAGGDQAGRSPWTARRSRWSASPTRPTGRRLDEVRAAPARASRGGRKRGA